MWAAFTTKQNAQDVKNYILKHKLSHPVFLPHSELDHIYFPLSKKHKVPKAKLVKPKFTFDKRPGKTTIKDILKNKLTKKQLSLLPRAQEIVGNIMILEIPPELETKEKTIAQAYLDSKKNVTTVVKKSKMHSGIYRTRKVKILAGQRSKETTHWENGISISLHLERTYFSARSGNERLRLSKQIKKGENILVMFSGAGPFPLVLAKNSPAKTITAIELNPWAHKYATKNILANKITNVTLLPGDVTKVIPKLKQKFDRIAMPLPKTGEEFLPLAMHVAKPGTIIHLYAFLHEKEIPEYKKKIKQLSPKPYRILRTVKCGQFSPGVFRICFDIKVK